MTKNLSILPAPSHPSLPPTLTLPAQCVLLRARKVAVAAAPHQGWEAAAQGGLIGGRGSSGSSGEEEGEEEEEEEGGEAAGCWSWASHLSLSLWL